MTMKITLTLPQGSDFKITPRLKNEDRSLIDLTGSTFAGIFRTSYGSPKAAFAFTCTVLDQITNMGEVELTLPDNFYETAIKENKNFVYDVVMTSSGGIKTRIIEGVAVVTPRST